MSEKIKEYWGCLLPLVLFICFIVFLFYSNNKNNKRQEDETIGRYVYIDVNGTLHVRRYCIAIGKDEGELNGADRTITRLPTNEITHSMLDYSCSRCISDETYEKLIEIINNTE
ncbi:MAG: hypothetical protein IJS63_09490 [Bacteroidaceae bacterium]|nr:hypothetical protein [Bacteroidaceae bacterium]